MSGICIISGTNRPGSRTLKLAENYEQVLKEKGQQVLLFSLEHLPENFAVSDLFGRRSTAFEEMIQKVIIANEKFVFISPEYNGSYPGILKTFLEAAHPRLWTDKKAALVGVSDGRAGNLRGMDHLSSVLQYLKMHVWHNKMPVSQVTKVMTEEGKIISEETAKLIEKHAEGFMAF